MSVRVSERRLESTEAVGTVMNEVGASVVEFTIGVIGAAFLVITVGGGMGERGKRSESKASAMRTLDG